MNYTFEEAERELDNLFDKLIAEAKTDKEKYVLKCVWETYKHGKMLQMILSLCGKERLKQTSAAQELKQHTLRLRSYLKFKLTHSPFYRAFHHLFINGSV